MVESSNEMQNKQSAKPDQGVIDSLILRYGDFIRKPLEIELEEECAVTKPHSSLIC